VQGSTHIPTLHVYAHVVHMHAAQLAGTCVVQRQLRVDNSTTHPCLHVSSLPLSATPHSKPAAAALQEH
jgi:hypothetical protein